MSSLRIGHTVLYEQSVDRTHSPIWAVCGQDTLSYMSSLWTEHTLLSTRLLTPMHIKHTIYSCIPEDEPTRFEICRRQQKLFINLENCAFCWFVLYNCITMHITKSIKRVKLVLLCLPVAVAWQNTVKVDNYCHSHFCRNYCLSIDVSPSSSAEVEIEWSYTPTLSLYMILWNGQG
jgi:hypothetical protein